MLKCHCSDPIYGTNSTCELAGNLNDDSHKLTQKVIDMLDLQMDIRDEKLYADELINGKRTLIWTSKCDLDPITFEFTEGV